MQSSLRFWRQKFLIVQCCSFENKFCAKLWLIFKISTKICQLWIKTLKGPLKDTLLKKPYKKHLKVCRQWSFEAGWWKLRPWRSSTTFCSRWQNSPGSAFSDSLPQRWTFIVIVITILSFVNFFQSLLSSFNLRLITVKLFLERLILNSLFLTTTKWKRLQIFSF